MTPPTEMTPTPWNIQHRCLSIQNDIEFIVSHLSHLGFRGIPGPGRRIRQAKLHYIVDLHSTCGQFFKKCIEFGAMVWIVKDVIHLAF